MKRSALFITSLFLFISSAYAHDAKFHKGPMIEGKLVSVQGDKAQLDTGKEKVTVLLSSETKFETGEEGKPASKGDLKDGIVLMVHGHKLDTGEFGATEVLINPAAHHDGGGTEHEGVPEHSHDSK